MTVLSLLWVLILPLALKVISLCFHFCIDKKTSFLNPCVYGHVNVDLCLNVSNGTSDLCSDCAPLSILPKECKVGRDLGIV